MNMAAGAGAVEQVMNPTSNAQELEVWIGYTKHGRNYLDKQAKALNTEQQILRLVDYYKQHFSTRERAVLRWIYCQRPIVQICEVTIVSPGHQA
jgi:ribosomal protein S15P/S13E